MEVNGDIKHRMRAMAYATVYGVEITNYTPTSGEQADIEQMVEQIRNKMEPSFGRPSTKGPAANPKPTP
jgi:hypothetical protein